MLVVKPTKVLSTMKTTFRSSTSTYGPGCGRSITNNDRAERKGRQAGNDIQARRQPVAGQRGEQRRPANRDQQNRGDGIERMRAHGRAPRKSARTQPSTES